MVWIVDRMTSLSVLRILQVHKSISESSQGCEICAPKTHLRGVIFDTPGGSRYVFLIPVNQPFHNWHEISFFPNMMILAIYASIVSWSKKSFIYISLPFRICLQYTKSKIFWCHVVVNQNNHDPRDEQNQQTFGTLFVAMRNFHYIPTHKNINHPGKWRFTHDFNSDK